ncbi:MAG: hypothetical protein JWN40_2213 [Phycisphaerales bacterium]|nr:hypothetical protein [Phycisphaerales bacterium]
MTNLSSRLGRIERKVGGRPCPAVGKLPRCVLVDTEEEHERFLGQLGELEQLCTCGRCNRVKLILLHHSFHERCQVVVRPDEYPAAGPDER